MTLEDIACICTSQGAIYELRSQKFFSQRSVHDWNQLPQTVVDATFVNMFKNRLDIYWRDMGI